MGFLGRNGDSKILKVSAFIFPSWKKREEYRSSRDIGCLVPGWYDEGNSLIFFHRTLKKSSYRWKCHFMQGGTEDYVRRPQWGYRYQPLVTFAPNAKRRGKKRDTEREILAVSWPSHRVFWGVEFNTCFLGVKSMKSCGRNNTLKKVLCYINRCFYKAFWLKAGRERGMRQRWSRKLFLLKFKML